MRPSPSAAGRGRRAPGAGRGAGALWSALPVGAAIGAVLAVAVEAMRLDAPRALLLPAAGALVGVAAGALVRWMLATRVSEVAARLRTVAASLAAPPRDHGAPPPPNRDDAADRLDAPGWPEAPPPLPEPSFGRGRHAALSGLAELSSAESELAVAAAGREIADAVVERFANTLRRGVASPRWGDVAAAALVRAIPVAGCALLLRTGDGLHVVGARGLVDPAALTRHHGVAAAVDARDATRCDPAGVRLVDADDEVEDLVVCPARDDRTVGAVVVAGRGVWRPASLALLNRLAATWAGVQSVTATVEQVRELAAVDPTTGAFDARFGHRRLREELARARRTGTRVGVALVGVDAHGALVGRHGEAFGDRVLRLVAAAATATVRLSDVVVRSAGEEFLVVAPEVTPDGLARLGERLRAAVEGVQLWDRGEVARVTATVGVAVAHGVSQAEAPRLVDRARRAMAEGRREGGNRVAVAPA